MNYEPKLKLRTELRGTIDIPPPTFRRGLALSNLTVKSISPALELGRILVPIDFSPASDAALRVAVRLARQHNSEVMLLHVAEPFYGHGLLDSSARMKNRANQEKESLRKLRERVDRHSISGVRFEFAVEQGNPQYKILTTAEAVRPDLIVLGRNKGGPLRRMIFGGVSTDVLNEAECPVLLINDKSASARTQRMES